MEFFKKSIFLVLMMFCFSFCGTNYQTQMEFPQEIARAYYETVELDDQQQVVKLSFYIEFKESLSKEINLRKVYFRNQVAEIKKVSDKKYLAHFIKSPVIQDIILDRDSKKEYGNKPPIIVKPKFVLKADEAMLEYQKNSDTIYFKLRGIIEKE